MGARQVTLTDLTEPLLRNLLKTVCANFCSDEESSSAQIDTPGVSGFGANPCDGDGFCGDLDFSDAQSVSDEEELFGVEPLNQPLPEELQSLSSNHGAERGAQQRASSFQQWDVASVRVRALDWKEEWDRYVQAHGKPMPPPKSDVRCRMAQGDEDETTSALDSVHVRPCPYSALHPVFVRLLWPTNVSAYALPLVSPPSPGSAVVLPVVLWPGLSWAAPPSPLLGGPRPLPLGVVVVLG